MESPTGKVYSGQPGNSTTLPEVHSSQQALSAFKRFAGRPVQIIKADAHYKWLDVFQHLSKIYGDKISQQVLKNTVPQKLSNRKVNLLYHKAEQLKASTLHKNQKHLKDWLSLSKKSSPAVKALQHLCPGLNPLQLGTSEKASMTDHLMKHLMTSEKILKKKDMKTLCEKPLESYRSHFSEFSPSTAAFLQKNVHSKQPIFTRQLTHYIESDSQTGSNTKHWIAQFSAATTRTTNTMTSSPFEQRASLSFLKQKEAVNTHIQRLNKIINNLETKKITLPPDLEKACRQDLHTQINALTTHNQFLSTLEANDFSSTDNFKRTRNDQTNTAIEVLQRAIDQVKKKIPQSSGRQVAAYGTKITAWKTLISQLQTHPISTPDTDSPHDLSKALVKSKKDIKQALKESGIQSGFLKKNWASAWTQVANNRNWEIIIKTIPLRQHGKLAECESHLTPAAQMRFSPQATKETKTQDRDPFLHSYQGKGCASSTKNNTQHALNLHQTKLSPQKISGQPEGELFSGIRSGTLAAQKISDPELREEAKTNWAKEVVTAALIGKMERSTETAKQVESGARVPLQLTSTSLLTPDWFRHLTHVHDDELQLQREQYEALHALAESGEALTLYDADGKTHTVNIDLDVVTLNVGVNLLSLNPVASTVLHAWQQADSYNNEGLVKLLGDLNPEASPDGWVGQWLQNNPNHPKTEIVKQLTQQIRTLYNEKQHHVEGQDAYKLMTRLQLLAYTIDAVPHFNCKSGKDRTGEADARIKELAYEIEQRGYVPDPGEHWSLERKERLQAMMYGAGETEVLLNNVGDPRFKTATGKAQQGSMFSLLHHSG